MHKNKIRKFGLIGKNISYSFSEKYFSEKFQNQNINDAEYQIYDLNSISEFPKLIQQSKNLVGLNVTIPYKEKIIDFLDDLDPIAAEIGAVNTILFQDNQKIGYNTDYYGFLKTVEPLLKKNHKTALILGTGGASKAIAYALKTLNISYQFVSRNPIENNISYQDLNAENLSNCIIINCTPLGTFPNINQAPEFDYQLLNSNNLAYDLIYNPEKSLFLKRAENQGSQICNGYQMLVEQAEKSWQIWNKY